MARGEKGEGGWQEEGKQRMAMRRGGGTKERKARRRGQGVAWPLLFILELLCVKSNYNNQAHNIIALRSLEYYTILY
eukprot:5063503-Heterocapsa_arctica.AAC.1